MSLDWLWAKSTALMLGWQHWKRVLENSLGLASDALHVIAGVVILFLLALAMRKPVASWRPWLAVLLLTCINEFVDVFLGSRGLEPGFIASAKDLVLTMFLPTLLLLVSRWRPGLYVRDSSPGSS